MSDESDALKKAQKAHQLAEDALDLAEKAHLLAEEANKYLFHPPRDSEDLPVSKRLNKLFKRDERASWIGRIIVWGIPTIAALGTSLAMILDWVLP